jgi:very-short-patch-repair endonuclease
VAPSKRGAQSPTPSLCAKRAKELRADLTDAEVILWQNLKFDFPGRWRHQEPIGRYICDFVSYRSRLVLELDGDQHFDSVHDQIRDAFLGSQGFEVMRFWNEKVYKELDEVLETIYFAVQDRSPPSSDPPPRP